MTRVRLLVLALALAVVAAGCGGSDNQESGSEGGGGLKKVTLRLDWIADGSHTCFFSALGNDYFREEGLDVQILEGSGSGTAANLVANGSNDFGLSDAGVVAKTINDGASIKMVMGIFQRNPSVIISLKEKAITKPQDLAGKSVGATSGEAPLQLLPAYLNANNVDPKSVKIVNIDPAAKITALLQKRVDAIVGYSSSDVPIAQSQAEGGLNVQHYADYGVVTLSNGLITSNKMITDQPDTIRSFARAVQRGFQFCQEQPDEAVKQLADRFPQSVKPEEAKIALEQVINNLHTERTKDKPVGVMDEQDWSDTLTTLQKYAGLSQPKAPADYYTNQFVQAG
ncbi:MAG TPA: ABC transporter substrate-binding protein [Actinomycetes bacterium]|nr:ABC transporter substrate-binding protein [Actinomycetes bacterium]